MKNKLKSIGFIILGAFILCTPAFYNEYPLVYSDTGTYIRSGFEGVVPFDRPITYGLFIRYISMAFSLWLTVFVQGVLLSSVIYIVLKEIVKSHKNFNLYYLVILILLTAFTGVGWYASQIMPDIFAPMLIISITGLLLLKNISTIKFSLLSIVFVLSCMMHFSHLLMAVATIVLLTLYFFYLKIKKKERFFTIKKVAIVAVLSALSWISVLTVNYAHKGSFKLSKGSHVFLMAHFIETGTMKEFLKENCNTPEFKNCKMCNYKDSLETSLRDFLWNWQSSLYKSGGWENTSDEYKFIFKQMCLSPNYIIKNGYCSFKSGLSQLFLNNVGEEINPFPKDTPPYIEVNKSFNWELNSYLNDKQNTGEGLSKTFEKITDYQFIMLVCSILILLIYLFNVVVFNDVFLFVVAILFFVVLNSFVTAGLNMPNARFQCRVSWLLAMAAMVVVLEYYPQVINKIKKSIS